LEDQMTEEITPINLANDEIQSEKIALEAEQQLTEISEERDQYAKEVSNLQAELKQLQTKYDTAVLDSSAYQNKLQDLSIQFDSVKQEAMEVDQLREQVAELIEVIGETKRSAKQLSDNAEIAELALKEKSELGNELLEVKAEKEVLSKRLKTTLQEKYEISENLESMVAQKSILQRKVLELEESVNDQTKEIRLAEKLNMDRAAVKEKIVLELSNKVELEKVRILTQILSLKSKVEAINVKVVNAQSRITAIDRKNKASASMVAPGPESDKICENNYSRLLGTLPKVKRILGKIKMEMSLKAPVGGGQIRDSTMHKFPQLEQLLCELAERISEFESTIDSRAKNVQLQNLDMQVEFDVVNDLKPKAMTEKTTFVLESAVTCSAIEGARENVKQDDILVEMSPKTCKINKLSRNLRRAIADKVKVAQRATDMIINLENANNGLKDEIDYLQRAQSFGDGCVRR